MVKFTEVEEIGGSHHTKRNGKVCFSSYDISYLQRIFVRLPGHSSQQVATGDKWFDKLIPYLELQVIFHTNQVEIYVSVSDQPIKGQVLEMLLCTSISCTGVLLVTVWMICSHVYYHVYPQVRE